jgi:CHASE2 domain-containing sensor protein
VRTLTPDEKHALEAGVRSANTFTLRRCQILLASSRGQHARVIAQNLSCAGQTVRNAIRDFNTNGLAALEPGSHVAHHIPHAVFDADRRERLRDLLHQSPRTFGKPTSVWTLELAADVAYAQGITPRLVSDETIRNALSALGVHWKRAKDWISSPDPAYRLKKTNATASSA